MQTWMIVLLAVAGVILLAAVIVIAVMAASVHSVLGHKSHSSEKQTSGFDLKYGVDYDWFDKVKADTQGFTITAFDGIKLTAVLVKNPAQTCCVAVCCHGYGVSYKSVQAQARLFYDRGFDVLLPTMRGHGSSEGKVGMGWLDRFDVLRWVDMLIDKYGKGVRIALFGMSMGGATVIGAAGMNPPSQVKCVIDDCGFSSQAEVYNARLARSGRALRSFRLWLFDSAVKLVHGYSISDADFVPLAKNMTVPALFIHGANDKTVTPELGQKLFDACGSAYKKQLVVPVAEHAFAYATDCNAYAKAFDELIDKCFADAPARPEGLLPLDAEKARIEEEKRQKEEEARLAAEKAEQERLERERLAAEQAEQERLERERLAAEQAEREKESVGEITEQADTEAENAVEPADKYDVEESAAEKVEQTEVNDPETAEKPEPTEGADATAENSVAEPTEDNVVDNADEPESKSETDGDGDK